MADVEFDKKRKVDIASIVEEAPHKHPKKKSPIRNLLTNRRIDEILVEMKDGSPITVLSTDTLYTALGVRYTSGLHS